MVSSPKMFTDMGENTLYIRCCIYDPTWFGVCPQPVLGVRSGPAVATAIVKGKGLEGAAGTVTAKLATEVRPVASAASVTLRRSATPAIWYVRVGSPEARGRARVSGMPVCPPSYFPPLRPACFGPCARCSGPEESHCLQCKKGWALHHLKCVGEWHPVWEGRQGLGAHQHTYLKARPIQSPSS